MATATAMAMGTLTAPPIPHREPEGTREGTRGSQWPRGRLYAKSAILKGDAWVTAGAVISELGDGSKGAR